MTEWAVADDRNTLFLTPRNYGMLDRALFQMVGNLIAGQIASACDLPHLFKVRQNPVAHAPGTRTLPALLSFSKAAIVSASGCWPRQCKR